MGDITRFEDGVTESLTGLWSKFGQLNPRKYVTYIEDFHYYLAGDWTITKTEAGVGSATHALDDGHGGRFLITCDAADDDNVFFQKVKENFRFTAGKKAWFEAKLKTSDATQSDIVVGLQITDTTPLAVTDGVYFLKSDGAATVNFVTLMNSAGTTQASVATMADNTDITLGFYYDGAGSIEVYADDVKVATVAVTIGTTLVNDEDLTISFGIQNGEAVAKTLNVDYIIAIMER